MKLAKFGPLSCFVHGGTDGAGGGDGPLVVLCHGFGAPGTDLIDLGQVLERYGAPAGTRFVFPQAPLALGGPFGDGRAWWHIDMVALDHAMRTGRMRDLANTRPPGIDEARDNLSASLDAMISTLKPRDERVMLGGFSQGAMVSTELALEEPQRPLAGLILLSGTLLSQDRWIPAMGDRAGLAIFQSHGTEDPILPFGLAEQLAAEWKKAGAQLEFYAFRGPHTIPMPILERLGAFCQRTLS